MSNNVSAVMDDTYNYSMWVEVYNSGTSAVNINNYYFSDDMVIIEQASNKQVKIYDLTGKIVINTVCKSEKETIQLDNLQKGIYIIMVENIPSKIIKQ